jgi:hypothetical protein
VAATVSELPEFLLARIAEDYDIAADGLLFSPDEWPTFNEEIRAGQLARVFVEHNARRVLADCEAKRLIIEQCQKSDIYGPGAEFLCRHIPALLAIPYADHPDYQEEWKP